MNEPVYELVAWGLGLGCLGFLVFAAWAFDVLEKLRRRR